MGERQAPRGDRAPEGQGPGGDAVSKARPQSPPSSPERKRSLLAPSPDPGSPPSPPPPGRPSCPLRDLSKGLERTIITELVTKIKGSPKIPVSRPQASSPEDPAEVGPARAGPQCAAWRGPRALQKHSLAGLPSPGAPSHAAPDMELLSLWTWARPPTWILHPLWRSAGTERFKIPTPAPSSW